MSDPLVEVSLLAIGLIVGFCLSWIQQRISFLEYVAKTKELRTQLDRLERMRESVVHHGSPCSCVSGSAK